MTAAAFARLFNRPEAAAVLSALRRLTQQRVLPPTASDREVWYLEGQRALFATILSFIQQGQQPKEKQP